MGTYESDELPHLRLSQKQKDRCRRGNAGAGKKQCCLWSMKETVMIYFMSACAEVKDILDRR